MESRTIFLTPCSTKKSQTKENKEEDEVNNEAKRVETKKRIIISKPKKPKSRIVPSNNSSSSSSSTSSNYIKGVHVGSRKVHGKRWVPRADSNSDNDDSLQELALPMGMSFAAIVSQVLDGVNGSRKQINADQLSLICTSAVKASVANISGNRVNRFLLNFENSFCITLRTLRFINEASAARNQNTSSQIPVYGQENTRADEPSITEQINSFPSSSLINENLEKFEGIPPVAPMNNQVVLHRQMSQEVAIASHNFAGPGLNQSIMSTFEKSVMEQTRSNDLKAFEIGLIRRKLQLKESQLALSSCANMLERVKISMGTLKASFKEEKLRNQMLDARHAEFLRRCIDLLVSGLIVMSVCLGYGAYMYSYRHITEATASCSATPKEPSSWWIPKPMTSFNSSWLMLRCQVIAFSRMFFGLAMIMAIAYAVFQRSSSNTPATMPVTFILLLGILCGIAGKICVDTLGGSGFFWLIYWEALCLIHFFANIFPSFLYRILYGRISMSSQTKGKGKFVPYWMRRLTFNLLLSIVCPAMCGLLPFASLGDWKLQFSEKVHLYFIQDQQ